MQTTRPKEFKGLVQDHSTNHWQKRVRTRLELEVRALLGKERAGRGGEEVCKWDQDDWPGVGDPVLWGLGPEPGSSVK